MRIARVHSDNGVVAVTEHGGQWHAVESIFDAPLRFTGQVINEPVSFATPVQPMLIFGMLHNTAPAGREQNPQAFMKSSRAICAHGNPILIDPNIGRVKGEGELAIVVKKTCRFISPDQAADYILGWTIGNDVTNVDQAELDSTFNQAKGGDCYTPLGPWIETDLDPLNAPISVFIDGIKVLSSSSARLAYNPYEILAHLSQFHTLGPGDVILTGAPDTGYPLEIGQKMSILIDGIGTLTNTAAPHPATGGNAPWHSGLIPVVS